MKNKSLQRGIAVFVCAVCMMLVLFVENALAEIKFGILPA